MVSSTTRLLSVVLDTNGQGSALLQPVPFPVKEVRIKSCVFDDATSPNADFFVIWSDLQPNSPHGIVFGSNQSYTINGVSDNIRFIYPSEKTFGGVINFRVTDILGAGVTLDSTSAVCVIAEFIG